MLNRVLYRFSRWLAGKTGLKQEMNLFIEAEVKVAQQHLNDKHNEERQENRQLQSRIALLEQNYTKLEEVNSRLNTQLGKFEGVTHRAAAYNTDLQFLEVRCDKPILWVCGDPSMHNSGSFARIMDRLRRLCPKVDLVVFTPTGTKIEEMDDEELARYGLARILPTSYLESGQKRIESGS